MKPRSTWFMLLILVLAIVLRLWGLNRQSIWWDEAVVANVAMLDAREIPAYLRVLEKTPPVHYELIHFWVKIFPNSEWWIRLPSVIAGVGAVWVMYLLVTNLSGRTATGVIAALFLAVDPYHIRYSQECRAYALMVLLSLVSTHLLIQAIELRSRWRAIAYVCVAAILLYTHLYGAMVIAGHAITCIVLGKWRMTALIVAPVLLYAPWLPTVFRWTHDLPNGTWMLPFGAREFVDVYVDYLGGYIALIVILPLVGLAIHRASPRARAALIPLMLMPVIPAVTLSLMIHPLFIHRYGIAAVGGVIALAGIGATGVIATRFEKFRKIVPAIAACVLAGCIRYPSTFPDWRSVGQYLNHAMRPGDFAAVSNSNVSILYDYYVNRPDIPMARFDTPVIPIAPTNPATHVWVVLDDPSSREADIINSKPWKVISRKEFQSRDADEFGGEKIRATITVLELQP